MGAAVQLRRLLAKMLEGDPVPLVSGADGRARIDHAGSRLGDPAGSGLQGGRQAAGRGQGDGCQRLLRGLSRVRGNPARQRDGDDQGEQPVRHADDHLECLDPSLSLRHDRNISSNVTSPIASGSSRGIDRRAQ